MTVSCFQVETSKCFDQFMSLNLLSGSNSWLELDQQAIASLISCGAICNRTLNAWPVKVGKVVDILNNDAGFHSRHPHCNRHQH